MQCDLFLEIKRYQTLTVLKEVTYVVFVFRSLLCCHFYIVILYSKPVPVLLSVWFFATRASIICIALGTHDTIHISWTLTIRFFTIFRLIFTPLHDTNNSLITRGQFWPSGIVVACICLSMHVRMSMCVCVCVHASTPSWTCLHH